LRARELLNRLGATYLSFDARSMGLFRILLGLVLLTDVFRRWQVAEYWYTDDGIITRGSLLYPKFKYLLTFFIYVETYAQATLAMAGIAIVYLLFTLGFKTRIFHFLSLVCAVSLNDRIFLMENGGQYVLHLLLIWSLFLPLGRRFSLDAAFGPPRDDKPIRSLAVLGLLLQFSTIYFYNVIHKTGADWKDGTAVHYTLHHERLITTLGVWMRESIPHGVFEFLTSATLWLEAGAVVCFLSPIFSRHLRLLAIVLLPGLHLGFNLCLHLGIFTGAMVSFYALLIAPEHWDWLARFRRSGMAGEAKPPGRLVRAVARWTRLRLPGAAFLDGRAWWRGSRIGLREAGALLFLVVCVSDVQRNNVWPEKLKWEVPQPINAMVWYPRVRQYWHMFAPRPIRTIRTIAVEAETVDGRIVDPYNEVASRHRRLPRPNGREPLPTRLGYDQFFAAFADRVPSEGSFRRYREDLETWIWRYSERTGNPSDRIVRFKIWIYSAPSPRPGRPKRPMKAHLLHSSD
jgi:hypothetical protein